MAKEKIRKLTVTGAGRSYYIILPREIIKDLNWRKGEKKIVRQEGKKIIIEDWVP
jgi:bifunctional DNA-binding transcriptional regulator/antitoxin component of YhaV-PrlF toxin-antitoxin module